MELVVVSDVNSHDNGVAVLVCELLDAILEFEDLELPVCDPRWLDVNVSCYSY